LKLPITRLLAYILVAGAVGSALGVAYMDVILPSSTLTTPKVTWTINPLTISFAATDVSGSATDTFSCSPSTGAISLRTVSNSPGIISLTTLPTSYSSCGASLLQVTVIATCQVSPSQCRGSFSGLVQVRQPINYRTLPANLMLNITVG
jgi:ABC-type multidrug transport system permease subunit